MKQQADLSYNKSVEGGLDFMDTNAKNRAKCIAIYNQKGGVAKTTTSVCCAQILGEALDKNVLLIDFDFRTKFIFQFFFILLINYL